MRYMGRRGGRGGQGVIPGKSGISRRVQVEQDGLLLGGRNGVALEVRRKS